MSLFLLTFHFSLLADERPSTTGVDLFGFGESDLLFVADAYLSLMEDGATNIDWLELHKDTFLSEKDEKPRPAYFALQMIHRLANSNASIVDAESNNSLLAVHTVQRQDGSVGVMLINKDPKNSATVRVKITGAT